MRSTSSRRRRPVSSEPRAAQVADALDAMGLRDQCISRLVRFAPGGPIVGSAFTMARAPATPGTGERYAGLLEALDAVRQVDLVAVGRRPSDGVADWGGLPSTAFLCLRGGG